MTTRRTLSVGVSRGRPSLLSRGRLSSELAWPARSRDFRCCIHGRARCLLYLPVSWLHAPGN
eukprot:9013003-Pyramimonas_sp.AAC.1